MNSVLKVLLDNIDSPFSRFIFPTDTAASRWADYLLRVRGGTVAMNKFIAWDVFKQDSIKSKVKDKKSVPSVLRKIFISRLLKENAESFEKGTPIFTSLIRAKWAKQAAHFAPWLTGILPQLGAWFKKSAGLPIETILSEEAKAAAQDFEGDDRDLFFLACRYAQFLDEYRLFEPAWETPPFNDDGKEYFLFFPQSLSDYGEYKELLSAGGHVKTIDVTNAGVPFDTFFYSNSRGEITEAALYIRALHEKEGVDWDSIAVCVPDSENYEPYVLREFTNRNIPYVKRVSKPVTDYSAGSFFRAVIECTSGNFAFSALVSLVLNKNLPWKDALSIDNLIQFGIDNNCICSWEEEVDGKKQTVNVWEDAFKNPLGGIDPETKKFYGDLKRRLQAFRFSDSFSEVRKQYFIFRERFFDMEKCSEETDLILSRCIAELMYLCEIEKDYPDVKAVDHFLFYAEYLSEVNYLAQNQFMGVNILPYKTAAAAPFECHIVLGAGQDSLSVVYSRLDFLPRKKREKLGLPDEDASSVFIELHKFNSLKRAAFFCSEHSFSGFTIPHSRINAPEKPMERYAQDPLYSDKFSDDLYSAENSIIDGGCEPEKLHENQTDGFENWKNRRKQAEKKGGSTSKPLVDIINKKFAYKEEMPDKHSVSASSLAEYYQCSLKWLFDRVLKIENVQIEADLMAENTAGIVYHAALNLFFTEIKRKKEALLNPVETKKGLFLPEEYLKLLKQSVNTIFDNFPKLQDEESQIMSSLTARLLSAGKKQFQINLENCLGRFLSFFCGCFVSGCEISYIAPRDNYFLNGKLDCVLEDRTENESKYIIVDFKLKHLPIRADCTGGEEDSLRDFQLPMYITLAEENEKIQIHTALFYSILDLKPEFVIGFAEDKYNEITIPKKEGDRILRNSDKYNQILNEFNQKAKQFADEIKNANFSVFESDYNECNNCNYNRICRTAYIIDREKNISLGNN
jgi:hypothetical protein